MTKTEFQREMTARQRMDERRAARKPPADAADRIADALHAAALNRPARATQPVVDFDGVGPLLEMLRGLTRRPMTLHRDDHSNGKLVVEQRCRACMATITTHVRDDWAETLAHAIRFDYDAGHRCVSLDVQLHGCSADELTQLHADTEAELERVAKRALAIEDELRRRGP